MPLSEALGSTPCSLISLVKKVGGPDLGLHHVSLVLCVLSRTSFHHAFSSRIKDIMSHIPKNVLSRCTRLSSSTKHGSLSLSHSPTRHQLTMSTRGYSTGELANDWSAKQYSKFLNERTRPSRDLLARVALQSPKRVIDLGCGPGNSTEVLVERYPDADISGIDSSADMIRKAKETLPDHSFEVADLEAFKPDGPVDLYFSNAVFQWLSGKTCLQTITRLVQDLASGGALAFQVPNNLSEPSHVAMSEAATIPNAPWAKTLEHLKQGRDEVPTASELHDALSPLCSEVDVWETKYFHVMENHEAIVEWVKGTGLRPFVDPLSEGEKEGYLKEYLARLKEKYPSQKDGRVLLPYPRLFVVATKA